MSTDVLERTEEDTTTTDEPPVAHYFDKHDLARVVVEDAWIEALCGRRFQPLLAGVGLPVCEKCKTIYNLMRD